MKSILLSIKPRWVAKILNGKKTIEVRKLFPKDYVGWVYLYCSKNGKDLLIEKYSKKAIFVNHLHDTYGEKDILNGKVVARFWCDKVEEIVCHNMFNVPTYNTELLFERQLCIKSCLGVYDLFDYLGNKNGCAIHISKLEIFDRPKELGEFYTTNLDKEIDKLFDNSIQLENGKWVKPLTKAPQNYCYIEGEYSMNKELTPLQEINKPICIEYTENSANDKLCYRRYQVDIIETALKESEHSQKQRELYFKQAKELKELYKEELKNTAYYNNLALKYKKALEMIKENLVVDYDESENDKYCLTIGVKVDKDKLVVIYQTFDENKIRLLKEILK